ncbi:MAG: GIN domain-containing protein [Muribaculaceae bacterium]
MKRKLVLLLMLGVMCSAMAAVHRYEKNFGDVRHVRVLNDLDVDVVCDADSAGIVVFFATDEAVDRLIFENNTKGRLTIQTDNATNPVELPRVKVFVGEPESVENSSGGSVTIEANNKSISEIKLKISGNGKLVANELDATIVNASINTGKGEIELNGKCQKLEASNVGKGEIKAYELKAKEVSSRIVGTGKVLCTVDGGELYLRGSGTGKLLYKGTPSKVTVKQIGTIKAVPAE